MAQVQEDSSTLRTSTEKLNFELAQPKSVPLMNSDTAEVYGSMKNYETGKPEKSYLETEIDSYSGVNFKNRNSFPSSIRPPTPPKPTMRAFTFGSTNPFSTEGPDKTGPNSTLYTTVSKPKTRPNVPPKPSLKGIRARTGDSKNHSTHLSSTSLMNNPGDSISSTTCDENIIHRVNSLPNLIGTQLVQTSNTQQPVVDVQRHSTIGYGMIGKLRSVGASSKPLCIMSNRSNTVDYCDMILEGPPYINELPNHSENVYEDVKISSPKQSPHNQGIPLQFVSDFINNGGASSEMSPISDVNFTFENYSIYENLPAFRPSSRVGVYGSDAFQEVFEPPLQFSSTKTGYPIIPDSNRPPEHYEYNTANYVNCGTASRRLSELSPSSSFTDYNSSIASTTASSFQGVQVCYFPPQPPQGFHGDVNTCGLPSTHKPMRPGSLSDLSTASSTNSRRSRSRIPVPVKSSKPESYSHSKITVPDEPAPRLPPTPSPSPAPIPKNKKKGTKPEIKLSPPSPPSGKGARWFEKLGCIQTDTTQSAEPYGPRSERKRSKSLNKEQRRSKFFVPVEPNVAPPDTSGSTNSTAKANDQNLP